MSNEQPWYQSKLVKYVGVGLLIAASGFGAGYVAKDMVDSQPRIIEFITDDNSSFVERERLRMVTEQLEANRDKLSGSEIAEVLKELAGQPQQ